nr:unnamed protein product [Callosobruchus analis]
MDYTVGSVADLITGKQTPNKPKIATKLVKTKKPQPPSLKAVGPAKKEKKDKKKRSAVPPFESAMEVFDTYNGTKKKKKKEPGFVNRETKDHKVKKRANNDAKDSEEPAKKRNKQNLIHENNVKRRANDDAKDSEEPAKKRKKQNLINEDNDFPMQGKQEPPKKKSRIDIVDSDDDETESLVKLSHNQQNAERRIKNKKSEPNPDNEARTIFVGNVPMKAEKKQIKKLFKKYGPIESLRFRGIPVPDPKMPKKVAAIKKEFHPNRSSLYCYISGARYEGCDLAHSHQASGWAQSQLDSLEEIQLLKLLTKHDIILGLRPSGARYEGCDLAHSHQASGWAQSQLDSLEEIQLLKLLDSATAAEAANGTLFLNHHLRVEKCDKKAKPDESKAIFIGNLSFDAEEEELWKLFEPCGVISSVRVVRDSRTGMGKGFAYVNFEDSDAVQLALEMENVKLKDRVLRISLSNLNGAKKKQKNASKPLRQKQFKKKNTFNKSVWEKKKVARKFAPHTE